MFLRGSALAVLAAGLVGVVAPSASTGTTVASATGCNNATPWYTARTKVGRYAAIRGPVVSTLYARSSNGQPTFLDLGRRYPSSARFTVVIWRENRAAFGGAPEFRFRARTLCVRGVVTLYGGVPEIIARAPSQIRVIR